MWKRAGAAGNMQEAVCRTCALCSQLINMRPGRSRAFWGHIDIGLATSEMKFYLGGWGERCIVERRIDPAEG